MTAHARGRRVGLALAAAGALCAAGCGTGSAPDTVPLDAGKAAIVRFWAAFNAATSLRMKGDCAGASAAYREALALDPRHEDSLYYLGQCLREQGSWAAAREEFERLVENNPASARGHLALGALLASPDPEAPLDLDQAERHLMRAHEINAEETGPMLRLGEILIVKGDAAGARHWLEAASHTNARSVEAAFLSGYLRWEEGDLRNAGAFYDRALRAGEIEAPIKGVLGEGDRKAPAAPGTTGADGTSAGGAGAGGTHVAAPPLKTPFGRTLFEEFMAPLRAGAPHPPRDGHSAEGLRNVYGPVKRFARDLAARAGSGTAIAVAPRVPGTPAGGTSATSSQKEERR